MRLIKRFGLYTFLSFSFVSSTCALSGDSWCGTLMCVDATVNESTVTYELKALNQLGWMSIGFGPQMAGTPLVIMWSNEDGSVYLSQRMANGQVPPQLDPNPPRIASISASVNLSSDTTPILAFDIPYQNDTTQSLIWAFGVTRPPPDSNSDIEQHLDAGAFSLDLSKNRGGGGGDDDPRTSSAPENTSTLVASSTTFVSTPVPSSSEGASLTSTPVVSTSPSALSSPSALPQDALPQIQPPLPPPSQSDNLHAVLVAHAVFSFLGFCVCLPLAAIFTRWYRTVRPYWLRVHWSIIAFLAIPLGTIGWALGPVVVALRGRRHVVNEHQICGVILFALCLVQAAFGVLIHRRQPKHGRIHPSRNVVHVILGLVIIGLSFYETKTGLTRDAMLSVALRRGLIIGCVIFAALVALAYLTGVARLRRQFDQERLGWHLSLGSGSTVTRTGPFAHERVVRRSSGVGRRSTSHRAEDDVRELLAAISLDGPVGQEGVIMTPAVEMRELQSPVPVSVRAQRLIQLY